MQASIKQVKEADQPDEDQRMRSYQSMFVVQLGGMVDLRRRSRAPSARRSKAATGSGRAGNADGSLSTPSMAPSAFANAIINGQIASTTLPGACEASALEKESIDGPAASSNPPIACEISAAALSEVLLTPLPQACPAQEQSVAVTCAEGEPDTSATALQPWSA
jgi:hypothetical protein